MSQPSLRLYSAVASSAGSTPPNQPQNGNNHRPSGDTRSPASTNQQRTPKEKSPYQHNSSHGPTTRGRSPSPSHVPQTASPEASVYVLTLLTDAKHHQTLTSMRKRYFPPRLNKLDAHITLFHALPGSKLDEAIKPTLRDVSQKTPPFSILAAKPFRLNKGIAIGIPKSQGGDDARKVHAQLKEAWVDFLSQQDAGGFAAHYTIMNKVDDQKEVQRAFEEVDGQWTGCQGTVQGLSLFRYDTGHWVHAENFHFTGK
ncbi:hypothetical protein MBLNU459_g1059t1 [Dothideomycetes sp. NU459]